MAKKKKWIQNALRGSHKGLLHMELGIPIGTKIPKGILRKASKIRGKMGKQARLALTLEALHKKRKKGGRFIDSYANTIYNTYRGILNLIDKIPLPMSDRAIEQKNKTLQSEHMSRAKHEAMLTREAEAASRKKGGKRRRCRKY